MPALLPRLSPLLALAVLAVAARICAGARSDTGQWTPTTNWGNIATSRLEVPARFALHQNEPNPFRAATTIRFDLPAGAMVRLEVFDVLGRRIERLASHWYPPGYHAVEWDQRDGRGKQIGPGVYFYRIEAGTIRDQRKMLLLP